MEEALNQEFVTVARFYAVIQFNLKNIYWAFLLFQALKILKKKGTHETYLQM